MRKVVERDVMQMDVIHRYTRLHKYIQQDRSNQASFRIPVFDDLPDSDQSGTSVVYRAATHLVLTGDVGRADVEARAFAFFLRDVCLSEGLLYLLNLLQDASIYP